MMGGGGTVNGPYQWGELAYEESSVVGQVGCYAYFDVNKVRPDVCPRLRWLALLVTQIEGCSWY